MESKPLCESPCISRTSSRSRRASVLLLIGKANAHPLTATAHLVRLCADLPPSQPGAEEFPLSKLGDANRSAELLQSSGFWSPPDQQSSAAWRRTAMLPAPQLGAVPASQPPSKPRAVELPPSGNLYLTPDELPPYQPGAIELPCLGLELPTSLRPSLKQLSCFRPGLEMSSSLSHSGGSLKPLYPGTVF